MDRLKDLYTYYILDTKPEKELDELAQVASAVFDTPVSLITFIDENRQWYKAKIGIQTNEVPLKDSVCQYLLDKPGEILVLENPSEDEKFKNCPHVACENGIKFYAGAPLVSKRGNVLGTVCVVDYNLRDCIPEKKYQTLRILAKKIMQYIETRKLIYEQKQELDISAIKLKRLTDLSPGAIFKLSMDLSGTSNLMFISEGVQNLLPGLTANKLKHNPRLILDYIDNKYLDTFINTFKEALINPTPFNIEYKVKNRANEEKWHWLIGNPEKTEDNRIIIYGIIQDITHKMTQLNILEKILFDISHVIRRPTSNIQGIEELFNTQNLAIEEKEAYCKFIFNEINELNNHIIKLNDKYFSLKNELSKNWNNN